MLVTILGFGCNWWRRVGTDADDRFRFTRHAAFYNSTGVRCGRKIRRHWIVPGLIRFNGSGNFSSHSLERCVGQTFSCTETVFALGGNRIVFNEKTNRCSEPDWFLVVVPSERFGMIAFHSAWLSERSQIIAASHLRYNQETMLLMRAGDWVKTSMGLWRLTPTRELKAGAVLQLADTLE